MDMITTVATKTITMTTRRDLGPDLFEVDLPYDMASALLPGEELRVGDARFDVLETAVPGATFLCRLIEWL